VRLATLALILGVLAGCQPIPAAVEVVTPTLLPTPAAIPSPVGAAIPPRDDPTPAEPQPETIGQPVAPATSEAELQRAKSAAQRIAARFLKIARTEVSVRGVKAVVWPDASLGCGPSSSRRPVPTPGYLAVVEAGGQIYEVHMSERGGGVICPQPAQK
jgi:hypothetical protein